VGTGMEYKSGHDSGAALLCKDDGVVEFVDAKEIRVRRDNGALHKYMVTKFRRSNSATSYNQRPIVHLGEKVEKGDTLEDGPSMQEDQMALGQNA
ncbi:hypothetical protein, partial [Enterococcus faecalis]|uniref:hypothetical protein n=1 Tax=Enterococcus faecalis TaxID=1351 RepID=UPI003D6C3550